MDVDSKQMVFSESVCRWSHIIICNSTRVRITCLILSGPEYGYGGVKAVGFKVEKV